MATLSLFLTEKARLELRLHNPSEAVRRAALEELIGGDKWTLAEYIEWLNRPEPGVIKGELMGAADWAEYEGITKASELGRYLDACVEHEKRKDGY